VNVKIEKFQSYLQNFLNYWSSQGKHFPLSVFEKEVKDIIRKFDLRINIRDIKVFNDFDMLYKRTCEFIRIFCWHSPITTVYELQRTICEFEKVTDFNELKLGPLLKHPDVIRLFRIPEDIPDCVPEITTYDIHLKLMKFIDRNKKNRGKPKIEEFIQFMTDEFSFPSPHHLCVRISSFPLACSLNYKFRTSQRIVRERMERDNEIAIQDELAFKVKKWKQVLLNHMSEKPEKLATKEPVYILENILQECLNIFPLSFHSRWRMFFTTVTNDSTLRSLFTIAMYQGAYGVQKMLHEEKALAQSTYTRTTFRETEMACKSKNELIEILSKCLRSLSFPIELCSLAEIEQQVTTSEGVQYFHLFGRGPFLQFIANTEPLLKMLGATSIGRSSDDTSVDYENQQVQILQCIKQLNDHSDENIVSQMLTNQFNVSLNQLSSCTVEKLITDAEHQQMPERSYIKYMSPIMFNSNVQMSNDGVLGPKTPQDALMCLKSAPLLANLLIWSNWEIVYQPYCGSLPHFLLGQQASCPDDQVFVLELSPHELIKISSTSKLQDFSSAIDQLDPVLAAGHLISIAVKCDNINSVSTDLYAQTIHSKLTKIVANGNPKIATLFVFNSLHRIPLPLAQSIGKKVFLDPLKEIMGISVYSDFLQLCIVYEQRSFLHALGMKVGIKEWIDDFISRPSVKLNETHFESSVIVQIKETLPVATVTPTVSSIHLQTPSITPIGVTEVKKKVDEGFCKNIIDRIRREEFGIGTEEYMTKEQKLITEKQKEREGRSLQRLSEELYSKDSHFVLELVQNADDNSYNDDLDVPTLKFFLSKNCIIVLNNEIGFSEKNIRALCDVGRSTKDRHNSGYIGQKGIGFKSVFRITEQPEVHSAGFHIKFDIQSGGPIGYILPQWIGDDESYCTLLTTDELAK
jgi:hypothetical protein